MKPNYVMTKSGWSVARAWHILPFLVAVAGTITAYALTDWKLPSPWNIVAFGLIGASVIPLLVLVFKVINIKDETISFYNNKVVQREGIFSKREHTNILTTVLSVTVYQSFWGRIFNYGTISIDVMGQWDIDMRGVKNPMKAKAFLEQYAANGLGMHSFISN